MASIRPRVASRSRTPRKAPPPQSFGPADNVVSLRQRILPRHVALLARWINAGRRMGLCDASPFSSAVAGDDNYVLVWVRENIDPAYMVVPEGFHWIVVDAVRQQNLARVDSFEEALNFIRPVLRVEGVA